MADGSPIDVLRSLRRYAALILGAPPWTVRIGRVRVEDDQRPVAVVDPSSPHTTLFSRAGGFSQGDVRKARTLTIAAYPELGATAADSALIAEQAAELLEAGFERGLVSDDVPPVTIGAPWRLPLYDFAGVPMSGPDRAGPDVPYGYANITDTGFNVRVIQDPVDELRYSVIATVPVTWWRGGRVPPAAPTARSMGGAFEEPAPLPPPPLPG